MNVTRRNFLKLLGGLAAGTGLSQGISRVFGAGLGDSNTTPPAFVADATTTGQLTGGLGPALAPPTKKADGPQWVMVIDLAKCNGCGDCHEACVRYHNVPPGQDWIKVYRNVEPGTNDAYWFPRPCMQCDNPPCVKVCPVGATYKRADGIVPINQDRCIGCRYCMAACPYSARFFNWGEPPQTVAQRAQPYDMEMNTPHRKGVVEKCLFCPKELREGKIAACAANCPMGAIYMGDRNEDAVTNAMGETVRLSKLLAENGAHRHLEELGTEPRVYYLAARGRQYPAPPVPKK